MEHIKVHLKEFTSFGEQLLVRFVWVKTIKELKSLDIAKGVKSFLVTYLVKLLYSEQFERLLTKSAYYKSFNCNEDRNGPTDITEYSNNRVDGALYSFVFN